MRFELLGAVYYLLVERMFYTFADCDDDGLVHFVADNDTDSFFSEISFPILLRLALCVVFCASNFSLTDDSLDTGDVTSGLNQHHSVRQLIGGILEAEVKQFRLQFVELGLKLLICHFQNLF